MYLCFYIIIIVVSAPRGDDYYFFKHITLFDHLLSGGRSKKIKIPCN